MDLQRLISGDFEGVPVLGNAQTAVLRLQDIPRTLQQQIDEIDRDEMLSAKAKADRKAKAARDARDLLERSKATRVVRVDAALEAEVGRSLAATRQSNDAARDAHREIRVALRGMSDEDRGAWLAGVIERRDFEGLAAIATGPASVNPLGATGRDTARDALVDLAHPNREGFSQDLRDAARIVEIVADQVGRDLANVEAGRPVNATEGLATVFAAGGNKAGGLSGPGFGDAFAQVRGAETAAAAASE